MAPTHHLEDDSDEDLSDEQIRQLLDQAEAERRERVEQGLTQTTTDTRPFKIPRLESDLKSNNFLKSTGSGSISRLDQFKLIDQKDRTFADNTIRKFEDPLVLKKAKLDAKQATAGKRHFDLPRTQMTPEFRRELQLLKMRDVIDPKRFYKKAEKGSEVPAFSQVGTIIEGPTEYFNGRINNKDRKRTFVEEVLAQEESSGRFKRKYDEIQKSKTSGKKAFYKALKAKRNGRVEKR